MTPRLIHIGIEQIVQSLDSKIYFNYLPKEIDLQFNTIADQYISHIFSNRINDTSQRFFQDIQRNLDDIRYLTVLNVLLPVSNNIASLPNNYRDLINSRSLVDKLNCAIKVKSGEIQGGKYYKNKTNTSIVYNNTVYNPNDKFLGIEEIAIFTINSRTYTGSVVELLESPNRLVENEFKRIYLDNPFTKSRATSPVTEMSQNTLRVYKDNTFKVEGVLIDYLRKLVPLDSSTPNVDWNTEFPDEVIKRLIDLTAKRILFEVESQKYQASNIELAK